jgi:hypothetical protein
MGLSLYPWQQWLLTHALELEAPWVDLSGPPPFRYRTVLVLVARQNGKTLVLQVRALAGLFLWRERLAISLAQNRDVAFEPWREASLLCENVPALQRQTRDIAHSNGKECIELRNGARWKVVAANAGGRGLSGDAVFMDELREQKTWDAWSAVDKTRSARRYSQLWAFSNAGYDASVVLNELVRQGRAAAADPERNPTLGYFEWSAPDDADPSDTAGWQLANPSLGHMIRPETVRAELATDPLETFLTERLCVRVSHLTSWLPPGLWDSLEGDTAAPADAPATFAIDAAPDLRVACVGVAAPLPDGRTHVELAAALEPSSSSSVPELVARYVLALSGRHPRAEIVYDQHGPLAGVCADLTARGVPMRGLVAGEVRDACSWFYGLCVGHTLVHRSDAMLSAHIANAVPNKFGDSWGFMRRSTAGGPITGLVAVVLATHVARAPAPRAAQWTAF